MQGTAADLIKMAMIDLNHSINEETLDAKIIMQVHDELVLEVNEDHLERVRDLTESIMTKVASLEVDLKVDIGIGENWEQAH
jgi:DNA polymerase-1